MKAVYRGVGGFNMFQDMSGDIIHALAVADVWKSSSKSMKHVGHLFLNVRAQVDGIDPWISMSRDILSSVQSLVNYYQTEDAVPRGYKFDGRQPKWHLSILDLLSPSRHTLRSQRETMLGVSKL